VSLFTRKVGAGRWGPTCGIGAGADARCTARRGRRRDGRVLATLAAELAREKLDHPPLTMLFTVREESGLWGARHVKPGASHETLCAGNDAGWSRARLANLFPIRPLTSSALREAASAARMASDERS
jgi:hypothetical protein